MVRCKCRQVKILFIYPELPVTFIDVLGGEGYEFAENIEAFVYSVDLDGLSFH